MALAKLTLLSRPIVSLITLPGSGWRIWYAVLACIGLLSAYVSVINPAIAFLLGLMFPITILIIIAIFIPAACAVFKSVRALLQRSYQSAIAFGLVPIIGLGVLACSIMLFTFVMTRVMINSYQSAIDAAVARHSNVSAKDTKIDLGPPIVAEFIQPTMMWDFREVIYVENDDVSRFDDGSPPCQRVIRSLGSHWYSVSGNC
jgi:hypothetical protein